MLGSVRDTVDSWPAAGDVVLTGMSPVVFAGTAAVPVCLPAVVGDATGRFCWRGGGGVFAAAVTSPADRGMVTDGVTVQTDRELSTELLGSACVTKNGVWVDVDVALPDVSPAVFARAAAVPVSLPAITGVVSSAAFTGGGGGGGRC